MQMYKWTKDRYFKISIESELIDEVDEGGEVPGDAIENLVLELELIAASLRQLLVAEDEVPRAN